MSHDFNHQHNKNGNTSHLDIFKVPSTVRITAKGIEALRLALLPAVAA